MTQVISRDNHVTSRARRHSSIVVLLRHLLLMTILIGLLYPLIWMIAGSLKSSPEILTQSNLLSDDPNLDNFREGWFGLPKRMSRVP